MWTILRYSLIRFRGQILGWGIALALLGLYGILLYDTIVEPQARQQLSVLLKSYPPELMTFFGGVEDIFTPAGYLNLEFFSYMPIVIGIFAVLAGSNLLAGDEEKGTLDLLLSYPISRTSFYFGRLIAFLLATLGILLIVYVGFILPLPKTSMEVSAWEMALPFLSLFTVLAFFGMLALLLSMLLPSQRLAAMVSGLLLVANYFITSLARLDEDLQKIEVYTPLHYYQGGLALEGMNWAWLVGVLGIAALFALLAWWRFERRDIRVGGEGGWGLPEFSFRRVRG